MAGDYISREATLEVVERYFTEFLEMNPDIILDGIRSVPAADVVPARHGRWIKDGEDGPVYCSECGEEHEWEDYRASYCDTCGAKMDGGQDE